MYKNGKKKCWCDMNISCVRNIEHDVKFTIFTWHGYILLVWEIHFKTKYTYSNRSCILVSNNNISSTFMNEYGTANGQSNGRQRDENKKSLNKVLTFFGKKNVLFVFGFVWLVWYSVFRNITVPGADVTATVLETRPLPLNRHQLIWKFIYIFLSRYHFVDWTDG